MVFQGLKMFLAPSLLGLSPTSALSPWRRRSSNKKIPSKFLCEEDKFLSISKQKTVLLFQQKVFGFSCPYKSAILWRHIFDWHEIGPHSISTNSMQKTYNILTNFLSRIKVFTCVLTRLILQVKMDSKHSLRYYGPYIWSKLNKQDRGKPSLQSFRTKH